MTDRLPGDPTPRERIAQMIRVDHAGEYGAARIYAGQLAVLGRSDDPQGWRPVKRDGGFLMDVTDDALVLGGLSMPHSPRWYRNRLWVLNSGTGYFGHIDFELGRFVPMTFCPGYLRGLTSVVLRADTQVTNHGFRDARVTGFQSVLQAGTAVLVDNRGVPRVRCACGSPPGK